MFAVSTTPLYLFLSSLSSFLFLPRFPRYPFSRCPPTIVLVDPWVFFRLVFQYNADFLPYPPTTEYDPPILTFYFLDTNHSVQISVGSPSIFTVLHCRAVHSTWYFYFNDIRALSISILILVLELTQTPRIYRPSKGSGGGKRRIPDRWSARVVRPATTRPSCRVRRRSFLFSGTAFDPSYLRPKRILRNSLGHESVGQHYAA